MYELYANCLSVINKMFEPYAMLLTEPIFILIVRVLGGLLPYAAILAENVYRLHAHPTQIEKCVETHIQQRIRPDCLENRQIKKPPESLLEALMWACSGVG
jgi:hypothetical protein